MEWGLMVRKTALMRLIVDEIVRRNLVSYDEAIDTLYRSDLIRDLQNPTENTLITWSASDLVDELERSSK
jgi:hypothetical protein